MRSLEKRLRDLEGSEASRANWGDILDAMTDGELMLLEMILQRHEAGEAIKDMPEDDRHFLASVAARRTVHAS